MFKIGDKARVKTREEIEKTLDNFGECRGIPFDGWKEEICGREFTLQSPLDTAADFLVNGYYEVVEEWLEPCEEKSTPTKFKIGDKVQLISWAEIEKMLSGWGYSEEAIESCKGEINSFLKGTFEITNVLGDNYKLGHNNSILFPSTWLKKADNSKIEENVTESKAHIENYQTCETKEDKKETSEKETGCAVEIVGFSFEELKKIFGDRVKIIETPARSIEKIMEDLRKGEYSSIDFTKNNNTILAIVWMVDGTAKTGYARRAPDDLNNEEAGRALALARALNRKDIEKELLAFM